MSQLVAIMKRVSIVVYFAMALAATLGTVTQFSYADSDTPPFVPTECEQYVGQPSTDHVLTILTPGPYLPGDSIDVEAGTTDTGTGANRVRIIAIIEDSTVIHNNLLLLPSPSGSVGDTINIPSDTLANSDLDIFACFESPGALIGDGVTHHLNVGTFFVVPESAIGVLALIGSSLAVLGGYKVLRGKNHF